LNFSALDGLSPPRPGSYMLGGKHGGSMFVVRITVDAEKIDYKVFERRPDAEKRFRAASVRVWENEFESAGLYEARTENVADAVAAVKAGDKAIVSLIDKEPNIPDIDLSELLDAQGS
jgi:hypothetical protein